MTEASEVIASGPEGRKAGGVNIVKGLLWREWLTHGNLVKQCLTAWLLFGWVLLIFSSPGWILAFGVIYALFAGRAFGGSEVAEGLEEFSFSLPPRRAQRYLVRLALGGGSLLFFITFGLLAIALDLPQILWGIFVESGFTESFPPCGENIKYVAAFAWPVAVFAFSFAFAAVARSRSTASSAWLFGALSAGAIYTAGYIIESALRVNVKGPITNFLLLIGSAAILYVGYRAYVVKEGVARPTPMQGRSYSRWWVYFVAAIVILFLLTILLFSIGGSVKVSHPSSTVDVEEMRRFEDPESMEENKQGEYPPEPKGRK